MNARLTSIIQNIASGSLSRQVARKIVKTLNIGDLDYKIHAGVLDRPHYAYVMLNGARLARALGLMRISALEFGCAGGKGLLALERIAKMVKQETGVDVDIYGFDTGKGLPDPVDYRDLKYHWKSGFFAMDEQKLSPNLEKSKIVFGNVKDTVGTFFEEYKPAPVACIFHDLDFYSSTIDSFKILDANPDRFLPRVFNYFDDIIGGDLELYCDWTGERLAINEFNDSHSDRKFSPAYHLLASREQNRWYHQIRILHFFAHTGYDTFISKEDQQIPI